MQSTKWVQALSIEGRSLTLFQITEIQYFQNFLSSVTTD